MTFSTEICHAVAISSGISIQSTQVWLMFFDHLTDFVDISYLTHFATTSLVTFAFLLSLVFCFVTKSLYYNLGEEFQSSPHFFRQFVCPNSNLSKLSVIFNLAIVHSISPFSAGEIALPLI